MQQHQDDEDIERYLRTFQPRAIGPLTLPRRTGSPRLRWLVAAAVVVFAGCVVLLHGARPTTTAVEPRAISELRSSEFRPQTRISSPALTKLALDDRKAFDAVLTDESRSMFPKMREEQSALRVLA